MRRSLVLLSLALAAAFAGLWLLLPRRCESREQLVGVVAFWHADEAFVFVDRFAMGRRTNALLERLPASGWWPLVTTPWRDWRQLGGARTAYRIAGDRVERHELDGTALSLDWDLEDGGLVARGRFAADEGAGFHWTGREFTRRPPGRTAPSPAAGGPILEAEDAQDEAAEIGGYHFVPRPARERLRSAGWSFRRLLGHEGASGPATLPIPLASGDVALVLRATRGEDPLIPFASTVQLNGDRLSPPSRVLFADAGWREIPRAEFEARSKGGVPSSSVMPFLLFLLLLWLGLSALKTATVWGWLLTLFGLKRRLLRSVATTMSFPPAIPEQFPQLDRPRLDAFSRELEALGFEKLLDAAPVADSPTHAPTFCRIYAQRRHGCYGVILQPFPAVGGPIELRCMLNAWLDDGWSLGVASGKPLPAAALVRRPRSIGAHFPEASAPELLHRLLRFREQVCRDLGLRAHTDTSLENYIKLTLESLAEIRAALQKRNIAASLGQYYSRTTGLTSAKSQLVWLGDYPKLAEQRKAAGLGPGFSGSAVVE